MITFLVPAEKMLPIEIWGLILSYLPLFGLLNISGCS